MRQYPPILNSVSRQNRGIKQSHNRKQCDSSRRTDKGARKLMRTLIDETQSKSDMLDVLMRWFDRVVSKC